MNIYQRQLLILLPILNLICGLTIDLYAPSLSEIRNYYGISQNTAQSSITITVLGFAFGQFIFGYLSDYFGRKSTILVALVLYLLASLGIIMSGDVLILLIGRFLQGIAIGSFAINSRAVAVDNFSGVNLKVAIIYLSLAWGIGPIIAPYLGGLLATYFSWKFTLIALCAYALVLLILIMLVIKTPVSKSSGFKQYLPATVEMLSDRSFLSKTSILGIIYAQGIIFNLIAPFWVSDIFKQDPAVFGQYALLVGTGYFIGTLVNRMLLEKFSESQLIGFGLSVEVISSGLLIYIGSLDILNMYSIAVVIAIINFGAGFIFANVMASNISNYARYAGICTALQGSIMLIIGAAILGAISLFGISSILMVAMLYLALNLIQIILYVSSRVLSV